MTSISSQEQEHSQVISPENNLPKNIFALFGKIQHLAAGLRKKGCIYVKEVNNNRYYYAKIYHAGKQTDKYLGKTIPADFFEDKQAYKQYKQLEQLFFVYQDCERKLHELEKQFRERAFTFIEEKKRKEKQTRLRKND